MTMQMVLKTFVILTGQPDRSILGVNITPSVADVSSGPQGVTFDLDVTDESVIEFVQLQLGREKPDGSFATREQAWNPSQISDPCDWVGTYANGAEYVRCPNEFVFDSEDLAGVWEIQYVMVRDAPKNELFLSSSEMDALGLSRKFGVSKQGDKPLDGDGVTDSLDAFH